MTSTQLTGFYVLLIMTLGFGAIYLYIYWNKVCAFIAATIICAMVLSVLGF